MEQYSAAMSEEMQNFSLWEQDYYYGTSMMISQGFSDSNEAAASTNFYGGAKTISVIPELDEQPNADNVARNVYVVSSPETANPSKQKKRRSKGAAAAAAQSTTFLNASISNFRALVQQHTGCHNTTTNCSPKGPITLCFATPESTHGDRHINNQQQYYYS